MFDEWTYGYLGALANMIREQISSRRQVRDLLELAGIDPEGPSSEDLAEEENEDVDVVFSFLKDEEEIPLEED